MEFFSRFKPGKPGKPASTSRFGECPLCGKQIPKVRLAAHADRCATADTADTAPEPAAPRAPLCSSASSGDSGAAAELPGKRGRPADGGACGSLHDGKRRRPGCGSTAVASSSPTTSTPGSTTSGLVAAFQEKHNLRHGLDVGLLLSSASAAVSVSHDPLGSLCLPSCLQTQGTSQAK